MKRTLLTLLLLAVAGMAQAATLKIATVTPEGSDWMRQMRAGAQEVKERTEGRVEIRFYGGGVQGNDAKVLGKIRIGALQGGAFTPTALASLYPDINLYGMPMVFDSEEQAAYVREHMDATLQEGLAKAGFVSFGFAAGGFAAILSNTPVASLDDLRGQRVWIPEGDRISYASMEAVQLAPVTLPLTDVLTGLQTGLIDIVGVSPIGALVLQWHTKVRYMTELPLSYTLGFLAIDRKAFAKLSAGDQAVVRDVMTRIYADFDKQNLIDNREARDVLLRQKIELVEFDPAEYSRLRKAVLASNRKLGEEGEFTLSLYEKMLALAAEYTDSRAANALD
ncbi:MAG TPA: TRAP transporter substrate-binding protein DctP [Woeseiaceae bacterium]|nr:TRAP transporter substrate-binding protein DctP [Woeseiaceae bacterium]